MGLIIKYTSECSCGETMTSATADLTQNSGSVVEIDLDMLGDMTLECEACGNSYYVPAMSDYIEEVDR